MTPRYRSLTLAIHPTSRGVNWVAFENPFTIFSVGSTKTPGPHKNAAALRRIERLVARLQPEAIVLEAFEPDNSRRATRITKLGRAITALAVTEGITFAVYPVNDVQRQFTHLGATTRHDIAEAVARLLPRLARYLPKKRRAWESERWRMGLFCAAALGLTHYQLDAGRVIENLQCPPPHNC